MLACRLALLVGLLVSVSASFVCFFRKLMTLCVNGRQDEPTNHLDVKNVAWLENYLTSLTDVTSIIVSHDSGFLDRVCTHILNYESRKLKVCRNGRGGLTGSGLRMMFAELAATS